DPPPAYCEETAHQAPYLKLEAFLAPGHDEFPEEAAAMQAEAALQKAVTARVLPVSPDFRGVSLLAADWGLPVRMLTLPYSKVTRRFRIPASRVGSIPWELFVVRDSSY